MLCGINSYNICFNAVLWHRHSPTINPNPNPNPSPTISLPLIYCPADDMLFEL